MNKHDTEKGALAAAAKCQRRMKSKGWKITVFENCGWHWRITKGAMSIRGHDDGGYWCMMDGQIPPIGGSFTWKLPTGADSSKDPNELVTRQRNQCTSIVAKLNFVLKKTFDL